MQDLVNTVDERRKRLTREESRAQTRERLMEAAYQLFATEGIEETSIDKIAEQAGYSRGAFYSNFETKEEILAALADQESARQAADFEHMDSLPLSPEEKMEGLRQYALNMSTDRKSCQFYLELVMYGVRHPEVRKLIGKSVRKDTEVAAGFLDRLFRSSGVTNHPSSELIVGSFIAMAQGITMRQIVEPESLSDELVRQHLSLYFDSVITICIPQPRKSASEAGSVSSIQPSELADQREA